MSLHEASIARADRHLLQIEDLGREGIEEVLRTAASFHEVNQRAIPKVPALRGKTVAMLFYENSTRTRVSFETAAKRLSADTMSIAVSASSVAKGESLRDTAQTIEAMGIDAVVVRHSSAGAPHLISRWLDASVINAGDGRHAHPTQALLDCFTVQQRLGPLDGKRIAIVGDIKHSRVARSNVAAFTALGAEVTLVAPRTLMPVAAHSWDAEVSHDIDAVLPKMDVVYLLRIQQERMSEALLPSLREYTLMFGLTTERLAKMADHALVMHPGPMNRGVEIAGHIPELDRSVMIQQVQNGVSVRMAVLYLLLGSGVDLGTGSVPASTAPYENATAEVAP